MAKVIDLRGTGGQMVLIGEAFAVPTSNSAVFTGNTPIVAGSMRFNPDANRIEFIGRDAETWMGIDGQVGVFANAVHTHIPSQVGLGNVNNTSDLNKPISNAAAAALALKSDITHTHIPADIGALALSGTAVNSDALGGNAPVFYTNATNLISGTIPVARLPIFTTTTAGAVPAPTVSTGKFLKDDGTWSASGGIAFFNRFTGNATQNTFTLSQTPASETDVVVTANGMRLDPTLEYTVSGNTLTVNSAVLGVSDIIIAERNGGITGASGNWGSISGVLSSQVDLQSALDTKLNVSGIAADSTLFSGHSTTFFTNATNIDAGTLAAARLPAFTGDVTSAGNTSSLSLATVNSNVGTFGDGTHISTITVNAKGQIIAAANTPLSTFTTTTKGVVPAPGAILGKYLKDDGTWSTVAPDKSVWLTLEDFGGAADWNGTSGTDNYPALMAALAVINQYAPVHPRWPRIPRIELKLGAYYFSQEIDLKIACHFYGQGTGINDFNGGTRFIFPAGSRGITINDANTIAGGTAGLTTSAMGTIIEGISIEAISKSGTFFDWTNPGTNTCGIWMRTTATIRNCQIKRFKGNALQIVASVSGGGALQGNASGWIVDGLTAHECDGYGAYIWGGDSNGGSLSNMQVQAGGMGGIADVNTFGNYYEACVIQGTAFRTQSLVTMAACWYGGTTYNLIDTTPGIGAATTPGTNSNIWYPAYSEAPNDFYPVWSSSGTYLCMTPILCQGASNHSVFNGVYVEGAQPSHLGGSQAVAIGGLAIWSRSSRRLLGDSQGSSALYCQTGFAQRHYTAPGSSDKTNFGDYYEAGVGGSYEPATFWYGRSHKDNESDWLYGFMPTGEIQFRRQGNFIIEKISTAISDRRFGRSSNVPYTVTFPNWALGAGDNSDGERIWLSALAAPTTGEHAKGERIWNYEPGVGKPDYWECTTSGTPGTWLARNVIPWQETPSTSVTGTGVETQLFTHALPANTLGPKGSIIIEMSFSFIGTTGAKAAKVTFGGTTFWTFSFANTTTQATCRVRISNKGATNVQISQSTGLGFGQNSTGSPITGAIDTTAVQSIQASIQLISADDVAKLAQYTIEVVPGV